MPYTTVVAGNVITASWANNNIRDQVVTPFADASTRSSAIASPIDGQITYLASVNRFDGGEGGSWRPLPGQLIARGNRATSSTTTTTVEIGVMRIDSIPIVSGVVYEISTSPIYLLANTNDTISFRVRVSTTGAATTSDTQVGNALQLKTDAGQPPSGVFQAHYTATTTGNLSVLTTVQRTSGSGNAQTFGTYDLYISAFSLTDPGDSGTDL